MARRRFPASALIAIIERQGRICACGCGDQLGTDRYEIHFDHEVPLDLDGEDTIENLRALCRHHHIVKTSQEARTRGKVRRIQASHGLTRKKPNRQERWLAKKLEDDL